jgi:negative regulator of sigma-B (phosphoserine phosphatase)
VPGREHKTAGLDWGVATVAAPGETDSADQYMVQPLPWGAVIAVIDGIGHGALARAASLRATEVVSREAARGVVAIVRACHEALLGTRGVVMSIASLDYRDDTVTWLGVGNVAGILVRADLDASHPREEMFVRGGVVGGHLPSLQASVVSIASGDALVMTTDGIRLDFGDELSTVLSPLRMAKKVLAEHNRGTDDAMALVAHYKGNHAGKS